jgi:hypothetical protein
MKDNKDDNDNDKAVAKTTTTTTYCRCHPVCLLSTAITAVVSSYFSLSPSTSSSKTAHHTTLIIRTTMTTMRRRRMRFSMLQQLGLIGIIIILSSFLFENISIKKAVVIPVPVVVSSFVIPPPFQQYQHTG